MPNELRLDGLAELRTALRQLPADLSDAGGQDVEDATEHTWASVIQSYPLGDTGNLRRGVRRSVQRTPFGAIGTVTSTSPHAWIWEFGSAVRKTRQGWKRGASPSHHREGLIPIAQRNRRTMYQRLADLVRKAGFEVTGL